MRRVVCILLLITLGLVLCPFVLAGDEEGIMKVNHKGEVFFVAEKEEFRDTTEEEKKAFYNPGKEFQIDFYSIGGEWVDFFHFAKKSRSNSAVVFDGKIKSVDKIKEIVGEKEFAWYMVFLLVSIVFMILSNIVAIKADNHNDILGIAVATAFTAVVAACIAIINFAIFPLIAIATLLVAVFAAVLAFVDLSTKIYMLFSLIFYIASISAFFV